MDHRAARIDGERARREEANVRQTDPHGVGPARRADQNEPLGWPSSDRQKLDTTVRAEQSAAASRDAASDVTPPRDAGRDIEPQHGMYPPEGPSGLRMRLHNFMYLLVELERAAELGGIGWDAASAEAALSRLNRLIVIVQRIAAGFSH